MKFSWIVFIFFFSCAGYQFKSKDNPFAQYGIKKIYVPMFYNHTNVPQVSASFTKEITRTLLEFKKLRIVDNPKSADAVLVGIVESRLKKEIPIE